MDVLSQFGGSAFVFALFIIWKLVEEVIRSKGIKRYRKATGDNPGHYCKWSGEDHRWLLEIRDNTKNNKRVIEKLEKFLNRELGV